jgi:nicotinamidase/pyrazinamidase
MSALLVVDILKDFQEGGPLPVPGTDAGFIRAVNRIIVGTPWNAVYYIRDSHPDKHIADPDVLGVPAFTVVTLPNGRKQTAWPRHCKVGTPGADFMDGLYRHPLGIDILKGQLPNVESYSAFGDETPGHVEECTPLASLLRGGGISYVTIIGVATCVCVKATALDAIKEGFSVTVVSAGVRGLSPESVAAAITEMRAAGVSVV